MTLKVQRDCLGVRYPRCAHDAGDAQTFSPPWSQSARTSTYVKEVGQFVQSRHPVTESDQCEEEGGEE